MFRVLTMKRVIAGVLLTMMFSCTGNKTAPADSSTAVSADSTFVANDTASTDTLEQLIAEVPMPRAADELFDDFIFNYAANPKLQMERTRFPIVVGGEENTDTISCGEWKTEHFFMRQGFYTLLLNSAQQREEVKDTDVNQVTVEKIYLEDRRVKQYLFCRVNGLWMLTAINNTSIAENANASFLDFYEHFATDSTFQAASLNPIVEFAGPDPDNDDSMMEGIITDDTWPAFAPELPSGMIYNIVYGSPRPATDQTIFLMRGIANGLELEMTFKKIDGKWKLTKLTT